MTCSTLEGLTLRLSQVADHVHGFVSFRMSLLLKGLSNLLPSERFRQQGSVSNYVFDENNKIIQEWKCYDQSEYEVEL